MSNKRSSGMNVRRSGKKPRIAHSNVSADLLLATANAPALSRVPAASLLEAPAASLMEAPADRSPFKSPVVAPALSRVPTSPLFQALVSSSSGAPTAQSSRIPAAEFIQSFEIGYDFNLSLYNTRKGVHVHLGEHDVEVDYRTQFGVYMTAGTWTEFVTKLERSNAYYGDLSFIANNQLAVFVQDKYYHVQQIYQNGPAYTLNSRWIKLFQEQMDKICNLRETLDNIIQKTLMCNALRDCILRVKPVQCDFAQHATEEESKRYLVRCIYSDLCTQINQLYYCDGCLVQHPSQRRHACLMDSEKQKYLSTGNRALFHLNMQDIAKELSQKYCCCHYTLNFFTEISLDYIKSHLDLMCENGEAVSSHYPQ